MTLLNRHAEKMTPFIVMEVLERATELEKQGHNIIHLEVGEPDFDLPICIAEAASSAQSDGLTHYTHSLGTLELREAIAQFYLQEYGVSVSPDCIVVTSGSSPAILMALMAICNADDEVIISNPGYPCYRNFALACRAVPVAVNVEAEDGFQYNIEQLKLAITVKTKAIFINSPMNPSGTLVEDEVFEALAKLNIPILSDEIYHGLVYEGRARCILEFTDNAFVVSGFSKRFAMTGLRLGYLIAPKAYMRTLQILQQNLFICAPSTAQAAGIAALKKSKADIDNMLHIYNERRIYIIQRLRYLGFEIKIEPQGAFYVLADARKFTSDSYHFAFDLLEKAHVGVTPGIDFGSNGEGFIRFSYANSLENIVEGLNRIEKYLKND
jgi:(5-formylfuran-3-yl)methyl phosphate transaminase